MSRRRDAPPHGAAVRGGARADLRHVAGPFDIIGDVHGCVSELVELVERLGWLVDFEESDGLRVARVVPPPRRIAVFVGDLVDRGPASPDVLRIVMAMMRTGRACCVIGNHDDKFRRWLAGNRVRISHGLEQTVQQIEAEPADTAVDFRAEIAAFLASLPIYLELAGGALVVAHAGIEADMIGRESDAIRRFCIYGDTDGHRDANGLSIRYNWAARYRGSAHVVYGHTPVEEPVVLNGTVCIDTGCCFGGALTAYKWPEREVITVLAHANHATRLRPFGLPPERPAAGVMSAGSSPSPADGD